MRNAGCPNRTQLVYDVVFDAVLRGRYALGTCIPPERDMAAQTGTSRVTVRRAYAELEKAGVLVREQGRGTRVSDMPHGNPAPIQQVALLTAVREPFALEFVHAMEGALARINALLVLKLTEEDPRREREAAIALICKGIRNLVVWPSGTGYAADLFATIRVLGANVVFFDRILPGPTIDFVGLDNHHAIAALLHHAATRGCTDYVFVSHKGLAADSDRLREEAFVELCLRHGHRHRVVRVPWRGDIEGAVHASRRRWFPSVSSAKQAILCVNDDAALCVRQVLGPRAAVYGIDGLQRAIDAGIPTYQQPFADMANACCRLLREQSKAHRLRRARRIELRGRLLLEHLTRTVE